MPVNYLAVPPLIKCPLHFFLIISFLSKLISYFTLHQISMFKWNALPMKTSSFWGLGSTMLLKIIIINIFSLLCTSVSRSQFDWCQGILKVIPVQTPPWVGSNLGSASWMPPSLNHSRLPCAMPLAECRVLFLFPFWSTLSRYKMSTNVIMKWVTTVHRSTLEIAGGRVRDTGSSI